VRVLVAGAGLAGLHAGWLLHQMGHHVTVCEARDRIGGRVWSQQLENGAWVERGGEFIFPSEATILGLCARLGLPVVPHGLSFFRRRMDRDGPAPSVEHLTGVLEKLARVLSGQRAGGTSLSVAQAFEAALGAGYGTDPVFLRNVTSMTADPGTVSAAGELTAEVEGRLDYLDHSYHVVGGNQQIPARLASSLGALVRLESPVRGVDQTDDAVEFTLHDGSRLVADAAVIAVPLPVLRDLERGFAWPEPIEQALGALVMGAALKASVPLRSGAEPQGVQAPQRWWTWNSATPSNQLSAHAATAFASTAPDIQRARREHAPWEKLVQQLRPDLEVSGKALVTDWGLEVWTRGSYSSPGLTWTPEDNLAFNAPVGRTVLAGEHTSTANGTMDGALRTGQRAAQLLAACFG
jgi:monoamine oxidase